MKTSIVIPVYNGEQTLQATLDSIAKLKTGAILEIIIVNDNSSDKSLLICKEHPLNRMATVIYITNEKNLGLAVSLNKAIKQSSGDSILIIQQDIVVQDPSTLESLQKKLNENDVVAVNPRYYLPKAIWDSYPFWQKVLFDRLIEKRSSHFSNKCDVIKKSALKQVGYFDEIHYRTAGECQDLKIRLSKVGKIQSLPIEVIHNHPAAKQASFSYAIWKDSQLAEAYGVNLRRHGLESGSPIDIILLTVRPILALGIFIPYIQWAIIPLTLVYCLTYAKNVYQIKTLKILLVPFANFFSLYIYTIYFLKGAIYAKL